MFNRDREKKKKWRVGENPHTHHTLRKKTQQTIKKQTAAQHGEMQTNFPSKKDMCGFTFIAIQF